MCHPRYETVTADARDPKVVIMPVYFRVRKNSSSYSPTNLFGQPLLMGLPRENCDYERLYSVVLDNISRFVTRPEKFHDKELATSWWKPKKEKKASSNKKYPAPNPPKQNGVSQTNGDDDAESMDADAKDSNSDGDSGEAMNNLEIGEDRANDPAGADASEEEDEEEDDGKGPPKLFVMSYVNSYGNSHCEQLENDGKPLKIQSLGE